MLRVVVKLLGFRFLSSIIERECRRADRPPHERSAQTASHVGPFARAWLHAPSGVDASLSTRHRLLSELASVARPPETSQSRPRSAPRYLLRAGLAVADPPQTVRAARVCRPSLRR